MLVICVMICAAWGISIRQDLLQDHLSMASRRRCGPSRLHLPKEPAFLTVERSLHDHGLPVSFSHPSSQDRMKKERQADLGPGSSAPLPGGTEKRGGNSTEEH